MKRIVMLGAPASGKGTQGRMLAEALGVPHVSAGAVLRKSIEEGDPYGISEKLEAGELVPDEVTEQVIFPELSDGFVLDGYPRTLEQVKRLGEYLEHHGPPLDAAVELVVPDETLAARLSLRAEEERRIDDTPDVFLRRLEAYHRLIEPIREYYGDRLIQIDGTWSEEEVFKRLMDAIEART